jgi:hypothetical protein
MMYAFAYLSGVASGLWAAVFIVRFRDMRWPA